MSLTSAYLITTKNLEAFLNSLISAKAPERFTYNFLQQLEFKSTNDRLFIALLKGLGFLDDNSVPTQRYYEFLDQTQSKTILAHAIMEAYEDLFALNTKAHTMTLDEVKNKLRTLTQGQKTDNVIGLMANTFKALCDYADWSKKTTTISEMPEIQREKNEPHSNQHDATVPTSVTPKISNAQLHYNIQIHLPETRDVAVYDAIFRSLKEHLS